ncbi:MAG: hypothetical protein JW730_14225 [Anaerolineales bacterium]|nr:hypothetical protein [Anaerolineales bacterium]
MRSNSSTEPPADFASRVHRALRAWHSQNTSDVLGDLLLARQIEGEKKGATLRLINNEVLLNGLNRLKQDDEEIADLLQRRFLNQETALQVAYRRNLSEDVVFQRQRAAIDLLAGVIWEQELELRQARLRQMETRLESPTYTRLFGVTEKLAELRTQLESNTEPWLVAMEGLGGIGKTSLADALARQLALGIHFSEIGWISARRRMFHLSGEIETLDDCSDLTLAKLVEELIAQFNLAGLSHQSDAEKLLGVKDFLKSHPCLVVIDNLETVANYRALVLQLTKLVNPSKFLFTTRYSLRDVSGVYIVTLRELPRADAVALIRHEAETRGLDDLAVSPETELEAIYRVTGGNPLAIKLMVGQIHSLSIPVVLSRFSAGKSKPVEELLDFLYQAAWQTLDENCRRVLRAMLLVPEEGGRLEQLAAAAELNEDDTVACLHRLVVLSLITVNGSLHERRYSLHPLTQAFVTRQ